MKKVSFFIGFLTIILFLLSYIYYNKATYSRKYDLMKYAIPKYELSFTFLFLGILFLGIWALIKFTILNDEIDKLKEINK